MLMGQVIAVHWHLVANRAEGWNVSIFCGLLWKMSANNLEACYKIMYFISSLVMSLVMWSHLL